jgi:glutaredoxin 2
MSVGILSNYNEILIVTGLVGIMVLLYYSKIEDPKVVNIEIDEQNTNEQKVQVTNEKIRKKLENTFLGLDVLMWGWISVATNGISVIVQMNNLIRTQSAQHFSMYFIFLMTLLNTIYCVVGLLTLNWGLAIATFLFVIYNLTVVYFYYFGKQK